eukprot:TRINITY_DN11343_c0_g1_i1.p1 TRINITY_DN11343_c0_g1~~TRINITY_DN11343_c0_g1_i1.p1  ORF type:complete len:473 (+),score=63.52 TRINITY_DN11343_c0_g1_i1:55-1419(+)
MKILVLFMLLGFISNVASWNIKDVPKVRPDKIDGQPRCIACHTLGRQVQASVRAGGDRAYEMALDTCASLGPPSRPQHCKAVLEAAGTRFAKCLSVKHPIAVCCEKSRLCDDTRSPFNVTRLVEEDEEVASPQLMMDDLYAPPPPPAHRDPQPQPDSPVQPQRQPSPSPKPVDPPPPPPRPAEIVRVVDACKGSCPWVPETVEFSSRPHPGSNSTFTVHGRFKQGFTNGRFRCATHVKIAGAWQKVSRMIEADACDNFLSCPVTAGPGSEDFSMYIPERSPPGAYHLHCRFATSRRQLFGDFKIFFEVEESPEAARRRHRASAAKSKAQPGASPRPQPGSDAPKPQPTAMPEPDAPKPRPATTPKPDVPRPQHGATPMPDAPRHQPGATPKPDAPKPQPGATASKHQPGTTPKPQPASEASRPASKPAAVEQPPTRRVDSRPRAQRGGRRPKSD